MKNPFLQVFYRLMSLYIVFLILIGANNASGQNGSTIDSLKNVVEHSDKDTTRILALAKLSAEYKKIQLDSAEYYAMEAMRQAKETNFAEGLAAAYSALGDLEVNRDSLNQAKVYFLEAIKYYELCKNDIKLTQIYMVLGTLHNYQEELIESLECFDKTLKIAKENNMLSTQKRAYNNLGSVYRGMKKYEEALECFNQALVISNELGDMSQVFYIYGNLGIVHAELGDKDLAESYFKKTLQIAREQKDEVVEAFAMVSLGDFNMDIGNYRVALSYYRQALEKGEAVNANYSGPKSLFFANVYSGIGSAHFHLKNYDEAIEYLLLGFDMAQETGQLSLVAESSDKLSYAFEYRKQLDESLKYARIFQTSKDSLMNEDIVRRITEVDMQNKFDKLTAEREFEQAIKNATQKRNRTIYLMIIGGALLGLVIFLLLFLLQINKVKRVGLKSENLQLEKENLHNDLAYKNKELTTNVMFLLKKNELILNVTDKLKKSKMAFKAENRKMVEDVIRDLESASKGDFWKEFELRFQEVHSDFYNKLNKLFPNLTPNELKLCAFLRLNMSTKDIAAITFLSVNSINIARHRLRKKLNIDQDENLIVFLSSM
jgi:tetratricopeptide (TPR) repeat protein